MSTCVAQSFLNFQQAKLILGSLELSDYAVKPRKVVDCSKLGYFGLISCNYSIFFSNSWIQNLGEAFFILLSWVEKF